MGRGRLEVVDDCGFGLWFGGGSDVGCEAAQATVFNESWGGITEMGSAFERKAEVVRVDDVEEGEAEGGVPGFVAVGLPLDVKGGGVVVGDAVSVVGIGGVARSSAPGEEDACFVDEVEERGEGVTLQDSDDAVEV